MVAYSFQKRFAQLILSGAKAQTIRADRKRHARPGEQLQLFTGMRTKNCRLITRATCDAVTPIRMVFHRLSGPISFTFDGALLSADAVERFALADGFGGSDRFAAQDMSAFWFAHHSQGQDEIDFHGVVISWLPIVSVVSHGREALHAG